MGQDLEYREIEISIIFMHIFMYIYIYYNYYIIYICMYVQYIEKKDVQVPHGTWWLGEARLTRGG